MGYNKMLSLFHYRVQGTRYIVSKTEIIYFKGNKIDFRNFKIQDFVSTSRIVALMQDNEK